MYDGATSVAEAALMAARVTRRDKIIVSATVHPEYREVVDAYCDSIGLEVITVPATEDGVADLKAAERVMEGAACFIIGYPNFYGAMDDVKGAAALTSAAGAQLISSFQEAFAFGLIEPPGKLGADIVAGEGQSLGVAPSNGGPHLGLFGCRKMPGRLAGQTVDSRGNRGYCLTMSTREQHIRREKATSNICTNQGLMATASTIFMSMLGPQGLRQVALASHLRAEQTKAAITALDGYRVAFASPTFNEFVVRTPHDADDIVAKLAPKGVAPGVALGRFDSELSDALIVTATELTTPADIDTLVTALRSLAP
jgi:glycine dehydrogenase subunit 1